MICQRLLQVETNVEDLRESFTRYKNVERASKLLGIALQLIPIAGSAAAGVVSAGCEIVDGLSVKDVVDYAFGVKDLSDGEVVSFADRIFRRAQKLIALETMNNLDVVKRRRMEEIVQASGYRIEVLRVLFQNPSCDVVKPSVTTLVEGCTLSSPQDVSIEECEESCSLTRDSSAAASGSSFDNTVLKHTEAERQDKMPVKEPSPEESSKDVFSKPVLSRLLIGRSSSNELAKLWTAFILRYENETAKFLTIFQVIRKVLSEQDIDGSMLVLQNTLGRKAAEWMGEVVLKALSESEADNFSFGREIWARQFVRDVLAVCHEE